MKSNKIHDKVKKLKKQIMDQTEISTLAALFLFEYENEGKKIKPKLSKRLKQQVQADGFYLDL